MNEKAWFSNYGSLIDIAAPGVDILSLKSRKGIVDSQIVGKDYFYASGTSMACPHIAGGAALLLSKYPTYNFEQVRNILRTFVSSDLISEKYIGAGYLNTSALLNVAPPPTAIAKITNPTNNSIVQELWSIKGHATGISYKLLSSTEENPYLSNWEEIGSGEYVDNGELAQVTLTKGSHYLKLVVTDSHGYNLEDIIKIFVYATDDILEGWPQYIGSSRYSPIYAALVKLSHSLIL
ncbi:MAG: S8 family serine peptidase [bacterium]